MEESFKEQLKEQAKKLDTEIYEKKKEVCRVKTELQRLRDERRGIKKILYGKPIGRPKKKAKDIGEKSEVEQ